MPATADEREAQGAVPAEDHAPGDGAAIGAADAEGGEVLEDGAGTDEGAIVVGELRAEEGVALGHTLGGVVLGVFAGQTAFTGHVAT